MRNKLPHLLASLGPAELKIDGTGELAPHSAALCSVPEINGNKGKFSWADGAPSFNPPMLLLEVQRQPLC